MSGIYVPRRKVHQAIRVSCLTNDYLTDEGELEQMLACAMFMTKVFQACRDAGVTTRSATGSEVNLVSLMIETEMELGIYRSPADLDMLNRFHRYQVEWETTRRRRYCYAVMYRMTSGVIVQ
jgi:hypothetical protein